MRFFGALTLVATLASSIFVAASPLPDPMPVPALIEAREPAVVTDLARRCDRCDVSGILDELSVNIAVSLDILGGLNGPIGYDDIVGPCNDITVAIQVAIADILALNANAEITLLGGGYIAVCGVLADLVILILRVLASVVALLTGVTDPRCLPLIQALACLIADLVAAVLTIVKGLLGLLLVLITQLLYTLLGGCVQYINIIGVGYYWRNLGINLPGL